jgi:hypothetical protein
MKNLNLFWKKCTPYIIFEEEFCMFNMDFIFDTDQAQINSLLPKLGYCVLNVKK